MIGMNLLYHILRFPRMLDSGLQHMPYSSILVGKNSFSWTF